MKKELSKLRVLYCPLSNRKFRGNVLVKYSLNILIFKEHWIPLKDLIIAEKGYY